MMASVLTFICGVCFSLGWVVHHTDKIEFDVDMPVLAVCFVLMPVRMLLAVKIMVMAYQGALDPHSPRSPRSPLDPRRPCALDSVLSAALAADLREQLPVHLRFCDWDLAYSPKVHGTSFNTFYRCQRGPNIIILRDSSGEIFGGFAPEAWRPQKLAYGTSEAFVFRIRSYETRSLNEIELSQDGFVELESAPSPKSPQRPASPRAERAHEALRDACVVAVSLAGTSTARAHLQTFTATTNCSKVVQWSDNTMLRLGCALIVHQDMLRGTSANCDTFTSPPLCFNSSSDFVIQDFECWHVGITD